MTERRRARNAECDCEIGVLEGKSIRQWISGKGKNKESIRIKLEIIETNSVLEEKREL